MKSIQTLNRQANKEGKILKLPVQLTDPILKKKILNHWQEIPAIMEIEGPIPSKLVHQEVRSEILDILREGIKEFDESEDQEVIRHVLSSKELHKIIKQNLKTKIKLSNVYFHLHKLEEKGYVEIITSIKEGRHITHYYGRKARLYLWIGEPFEEIKEKSKFQNIVDILKHFNPELSLDSIESLLNSLVKSKKKTHNLIKQWIESNENVLIDLNLDIRDLYRFLAMIDRCDPTTIELHNKITKLLNFPAN